MRTGGVFHPNFFYTPRRVTDSMQLVDINIYALKPEGPGWVPGVGLGANEDTLVWTGQGRVQPNKDWRSRPREVQYEYDAVQAVRVQIPIGKNLLGAVFDAVKNRYTSYGPDPKFVKDMKVSIVSGPVKGYEAMVGDNLYIRNATQSQNLWLYNLLCDTKTGGSEKL